MEAVQYVEQNEHGSMVIIGSNIHVATVGFAHEGGYSEAELLEWFHLTKEQLYGTLAYFYRNRETLVAKENEAVELAQKLARKGTHKLKEWRDNQTSQ